MTHFVSRALLASSLLLASTSAAQPATPAQPGAAGQVDVAQTPLSSDDEDRMGAVIAPATLPGRTTALYGYAGAPELGVGFRQGLSLVELEARARFNWFQISAALELVGRLKVYEQGSVSLAPSLGLGVVFNSGSTYMDDQNFSGVLLRMSPGLVVNWRVAETVSILGLVDVPVDIGLSKSESRRVQALGGGGVEVYLGNGMSVLLAGQLGLEAFRERAGLSDTRLGWALKAGLGARLF
ncbi:hypothetical protein MYSTI_05469 [Myxococcus stipitatus DSM 14675]|uniref:Outer membrane protein beta-barrel domain-containing protein n=1 Tax=Myxococcus stipitatus (strain DSM 14675 / JCM 12634 / Mx s8) TaxID=1278073 RepID=L7UGQ8_MYXSD|nr:hypothetical protein [Myxococcus stipitatus]AGC46747.1 hypothetical protein MYSTI_05469 [Myxococcus stipitatus DSM 14675]